MSNKTILYNPSLKKISSEVEKHCKFWGIDGVTVKNNNFSISCDNYASMEKKIKNYQTKNFGRIEIKTYN